MGRQLREQPDTKLSASRNYDLGGRDATAKGLHGRHIGFLYQVTIKLINTIKILVLLGWKGY